jgi:hypothetical protein
MIARNTMLMIRIGITDLCTYQFNNFYRILFHFKKAISFIYDILGSFKRGQISGIVNNSKRKFQKRTIYYFRRDVTSHCRV